MSEYTINMARIQQHARVLLAVGSTLGIEPPAEYQRLRLIEQEASQIARLADAPVALPVTADKLTAHITKAANERVTQREARAIATTMAESANRDALRLMLNEAPRILDALQDRFASAVEEFRTLSATAPHQVTSYTSADEFAQHASLLRAVDALTMDAANRIEVGVTIGEDNPGSELLWSILDLNHNVSVFGVRALLDDYAGRLPRTIDEWLTVLPFGLSLAGQFDIGGRSQRFHGAAAAAGYTSPDGGMLDRTYGEALAREAQVNPRPTLSQMRGIDD